jgi:hypothetical protein
MAVVGIGDPSKSVAGLTLAQVTSAVLAMSGTKHVTFDRLVPQGK